MEIDKYSGREISDALAIAIKIRELMSPTAQDNGIVLGLYLDQMRKPLDVSQGFGFFQELQILENIYFKKDTIIEDVKSFLAKYNILKKIERKYYPVIQGSFSDYIIENVIEFMKEIKEALEKKKIKYVGSLLYRVVDITSSFDSYESQSLLEESGAIIPLCKDAEFEVRFTEDNEIVLLPMFSFVISTLIDLKNHNSKALDEYVKEYKSNIISKNAALVSFYTVDFKKLKQLILYLGEQKEKVTSYGFYSPYDQFNQLLKVNEEKSGIAHYGHLTLFENGELQNTDTGLSHSFSLTQSDSVPFVKLLLDEINEISEITIESFVKKTLLNKAICNRSDTELKDKLRNLEKIFRKLGYDMRIAKTISLIVL